MPLTKSEVEALHLQKLEALKAKIEANKADFVAEGEKKALTKVKAMKMASAASLVPYDPINTDTIIFYCEQGALPQSIARRVGVGIQTLYSWLEFGRSPEAPLELQELSLRWDNAEANILETIMEKLRDNKDYRGLELYAKTRFKDVFTESQSGNGQIIINFSGSNPGVTAFIKEEEEDDSLLGEYTVEEDEDE